MRGEMVRAAGAAGCRHSIGSRLNRNAVTRCRHRRAAIDGDLCARAEACVPGLQSEPLRFQPPRRNTLRADTLRQHEHADPAGPPDRDPRVRTLLAHSPRPVPRARGAESARLGDCRGEGTARLLPHLRERGREGEGELPPLHACGVRARRRRSIPRRLLAAWLGWRCEKWRSRTLQFNAFVSTRPLFALLGSVVREVADR
jgi:hypothetical protein